MAKIWVGPVGSTCEGHVLDCSKKGIESALKFYDPQLYVKWNPKKLKGHGCWEIRRRPNLKTVKEIAPYKEASIVVIDYVENDLISHVVDAAFLNYDVVRKIKSMDTWETHKRGQTFASDIEYKEKQAQEAIQANVNSELRYALKNNKRLTQDLMEFVKSGGNPSLLGLFWK